MTEYQECERGGEREARVTYTTGSAETIELCDRCAVQYENGGFQPGWGTCQ